VFKQGANGNSLASPASSSLSLAVVKA